MTKPADQIAKVREFWNEWVNGPDGGESLFLTSSNQSRTVFKFAIAFAASERQAVIEDCCRAVCDCCGKYAQYWHPAELVNGRWRHLSTKVPDEGKPATHLCDAAAIRSME